jgi:hypothetical protein
MRRLILAAVVVQAAIPLGISQVSARSGEEVLQSCEAVLRSAKILEPIKTWVPNEGLECWHYFEAVYDLTFMADIRHAPYMFSRSSS